ncbi:MULTISPECIES: AAA family ATPase [Pseudoalteromonas]|uniref:1-deoxy-D-xylulose-5-phosphate synthase n=1 Tax=Pseudoalteromonas amylolytica TaxID=1859457 RepID=A0A1S1MRF1_9GAMM|nr:MULTISPECIES: ATP-binding protein [Pseudoalteromonas]OHU86671.1 1-deoxy-D-xylulose-5-phosphate synthase [Pseudoalteromonas sp. JW3]OHU88805.1 1-deoxy-D-xylulose-5-phosphate synthase [Pseudoalteromonas amylolytica]
MKNNGKLFFFCGKMGAGKSTKSKILAAENSAVLISEDDWLSAHYPTQIKTFDDYITYSNLIKPFVKSHVQRILSVGVNVVMDFPANTIKQRSWFTSLCLEIGSEHELWYLDLTDEQCLSQIAKRRVEQPKRAQFDTEAVFHHVTQYFEVPTDSENLNLICVVQGRTTV